jgi:hypothetical protein
MKMDTSHLPAEAWTPWGFQKLAARTSQVGSASEPASVRFDPFLDLHLVYIAGVPGLVVVIDGHDHAERKPACPNQGGMHQYR